MLYFGQKKGIELLDSWEDQEGYFTKTYLINETRNMNKWRVTWDSILKNADSFVGYPGIEYHVCNSKECRLDHVEGPTYETTKVMQESYRVSTVVKTVIEADKRTSYAIHDVKEPFFRKLEKEPDKYFVSPAVWPKTGHQSVVGMSLEGVPHLDVSDWDPLHIAFVTEPAYGYEAQVFSNCAGMGGDCAIQMSASVRDSHPILLQHNNRNIYYDPPEDIDQMIRMATTVPEVNKILTDYKLLNNGITEQESMETPCELTAASNSLDMLEARLRIMNLERGIYAVDDREKTTDKPDVDERGQKCHWVKSKGRTFQICDDVKQPKTQSPKSERKEEERN